MSSNQQGRDERLIPKHGGYRRLKSFQVSQLVYDITLRFCNRYIDRRSRTHDQMVQAARSGVQNIAEGSQASGTSKKTELTLTNVARSSLEELLLDYEDYLRHRGLPMWSRNDPRRQSLIDRRCRTADQFAKWACEVREGFHPTPPPSTADAPHLSTKSTRSTKSTTSTLVPATYPEIAANGVLALIAVATTLLDRQLAFQADAFEREGGFAERLYRFRKRAR